MLQFSFLLLLALSPVGFESAKVTGPWDVPALQKAKVEPSWAETSNGVKQVYYPGENYKGKPTKIFAYYGKPEGHGPFPAVLLVHGGEARLFLIGLNIGINVAIVL